MIRERIEMILRAHQEKSPETLAAMIVSFLCEDEIIDVDNGAVEDDPRYSDLETGYYDADLILADYESIGLKLIKIGDKYI